jgi:hypothetical protein
MFAGKEHVFFTPFVNEECVGNVAGVDIFVSRLN